MTIKKRILILRMFLAMERVRRTAEISSKEMGRTGITMFQIQALDFIKNNPGTSAIGLAEYLFASPSSISQLMDRLFSQELIERNVDSVDRRSIAISLTKKGQREVARMKKEQFKMIRGIIDYAAEEEIEQMIKIHENMLKRMKDKQ